MGAEIEILKVEPLDNARSRVTFANGTVCLLYRSELKGFSVREGGRMTEAEYGSLLSDVIGKRAKKRAMHLLERMDYTEQQLREKLLLSKYPEECVREAVSYVKQYRYIDDYRYACNYVRCAQKKSSRRQLTQKLLAKGVAKEVIARAVEEEYQTDELEQIQKLLQKRCFDAGQNDAKEYRKTYQFLLRRGFLSSDILKAMKS